MLSREPFRQSLVGSHVVEGGEPEPRPARLELRGARPLLVPGLGRTIQVTGTLDAEGLCQGASVEGRVTFERWLPLAAGHDLAVDFGDGVPRRLHARPRLEATGFFARASTLDAVLLDAQGQRLARFQLRFDYRRDLGRYLT
jgi:hypothetical protein